MLQHSKFTIQYLPLLFLFYLGATAGTVHAGARAFIPKYVDFSGEMVLKSMVDGGKTESTHRSSTNQDMLFQEFISFQGLGYVYSPSFITLISEVAFGLQQEDQERANRSWSENTNLFNFRQELILLPNHPYNLHLYAGRSDEIRRSQGGSSSLLVYTWGARARYRKQPWQSVLSYTHYESSAQYDTSTDAFTANLYYFNTLTFWNANISYNHFISSRYDDRSTTVKDVFAAYVSKKWDSCRFLTRWGLDQQDQEDSYSTSLVLSNYKDSRTQWEWFSEFSADLPYNVRSLFSYQKRNSDAQYQQNNRNGSSFSDTDNYRAHFTHHLYKSLVTNLNGGYTTSKSKGGKTNLKSATLGTSYSKIIRWGVIGVNLNGGLNDTENFGQTATLYERHTLTASSPTSFTLTSTVLDPDTIRVSVIDPFNNGAVVPLIRDVHYTVIAVGDEYRVLILLLPISLGEPWTEYTYIADYGNLASDYALRSTSWGGRVQMALFNDTITPYVGYTQTDQSVIEGAYPGILNNSTTYNMGFNARYKNIWGSIRKSWREAVTENENRFVATISGSYDISQQTGGSCTFTYENKLIEQTYTKDLQRDPILEEDIYSGHVQISSSWPEWNLNTTIGINYSLYTGLGESTSKGLISSLNWSVGKMDIDMRLSYFDSESELPKSSTSNNYYTAWLTIRRKLF